MNTEEARRNVETTSETLRLASNVFGQALVEHEKAMSVYAQHVAKELGITVGMILNHAGKKIRVVEFFGERWLVYAKCNVLKKDGTDSTRVDVVRLLASDWVDASHEWEIVTP